MRKWDLTKKGQTVEKAYETEKNAGSYNEIFKKYRDPATRYAFAVLEGRQLAGKKIKLDAFRHFPPADEGRPAVSPRSRGARASCELRLSPGRVAPRAA